jgi:hypothetical protein
MTSLPQTLIQQTQQATDPELKKKLQHAAETAVAGDLYTILATIFSEEEMQHLDSIEAEEEAMKYIDEVFQTKTGMTVEKYMEELAKPSETVAPQPETPTPAEQA